MSKAKPETLLEDWSLFIFMFFSAAFAGDVFIRLLRIHWYRPQWKELAGLGVSFILGISAILLGIWLSALNALGSAWPGLLVALLGIPYFYFVVYRIEVKFRQLSA